MNQIVLSIVSNAGGVGKTTIVLNLAYILWQAFGLSVAVIDLDNNASLYDFTGVEMVAPKYSIENVFSKNFQGDWHLEDLFESNKKVVLIPGSEEFKDGLIANRTRREYILQKHLKEYPLPYDIVILDNRGGMDDIVKNSLTAATHILIPCRVGAKATTVSRLLKTLWFDIAELQINPPPKIIGVLPNEARKKSSTHNDILEVLKLSMTKQNVNVYPAIGYNGWIERSNAEQIPLAAYRSGESIVKIYKKIAEDLNNEIKK